MDIRAIASATTIAPKAPRSRPTGLLGTDARPELRAANEAPDEIAANVVATRSEQKIIATKPYLDRRANSTQTNSKEPA